MDASYLKKNVCDALAESLAAMSAQNPEDKVEFLGNFLLEYVSRRKLKDSKVVDIKIALENARIDDEAKKEIEKIKQQKLSDEVIHQALYPKFLETLIASQSKQQALDKVSNFIVDYYKIPAAYIAVKKTSGDIETLNYISVCKGQEFVLGKKITKSLEEGEELPPRQGFSFDAFNIPVVEESGGEGLEPEEEGDDAVQRPPPLPVPLVVDNVLRDRRCKFFGIPKLGSYVAIPLSLETVDHESGCLPGSGEEGAPPYAVSKVKQDWIVAFDSIGKYRSFKKLEISSINDIGNTLMSVLSKIEEGDLQNQTAFLEAHKQFSAAIAEESAKIPDLEASALAAVAAELAVDPNIEPPAEQEAPPESLKPYKEAEAVLSVWNEIASSSSIAASITALRGHILPASQASANLLYVTGCLCLHNIPEPSLKDICGDITWNQVRNVVLPQLAGGMAGYKSSLAVKITKESSLLNIKGFCETANVFDVSQYPPHLPVLTFIANWLQKAIAARETALAYFKEVNQENLEQHI